MFILETGAIFVAVSICLICIGYNLKLAGYSRRKLLEGISFNDQMRSRRRLGEIFMNTGFYSGIASIFVFFVMFGFLLSVETVEITPKKIAVLASQAKMLIIADGKTYAIDGIHNHIKRIYFVNEINSYGIVCDSDIVIEDKDQWERLSNEE